MLGSQKIQATPNGSHIPKRARAEVRALSAAEQERIVYIKA
jgi:hypothetical protein